MMVTLNNVLLVIFLAINSFEKTVTAKLLMTVFYASNCPDSKSFVLQQLLPAMRLLHEHVRMRFVPFGIATSKDYGFGGFECQHGLSECFGNMVQDCTLELMQQHGYSDMDMLNYVACEMETYFSSQGNFQCVQKTPIKPLKVQNCIDSGRGTMLQLDSEYQTGLVELKSLPTITFNNVFDQQIQESAVKNLLGTLCTFLVNTKPCQKYFNQLALTSIMHRQEISAPVPVKSRAD